MRSRSHELRRRLRTALQAGRPVTGTFIKLAPPDVIELAQAAGFAFVVIDLEHSTLSEGEAIALVRHADACQLPSLVRVPALDPALVNRLLENGAVGIQLSTVRTRRQVQELAAATRFAPAGTRSISLTNRVAGAGAVSLRDFLDRESTDPPLLVAQIETAETEPLPDLLGGLDVCFVGTSDLAVALGVAAGTGTGTVDPRLADACAAIAEAARQCAVSFGGWASSVAAAEGLGLGAATYLIVGSDLHMLADGMARAVEKGER